jgi:formylglycine-generating enzyme required for sulfatase activity
MWEAGACEDLCPGDARPDEVCIPAGRFYRGDEAYDDATPVELVEITSSFYIMRWPYTMGEFVADVESGRIENRVQESLDVFSGFEERPRAPIAGIYGFYGDEICRVTRGGRLPTEAEWEYAARGPAPSMRPYAWGDERDRCDVYVHAGCPGYVPPDPVLGSVGQYNVPFDADAMPETASWFGVELMVLGVYESVADAYAPDYYREPDSLADPLLTHEDCRARIGLGRCVIEHFRGAPIHAPSDERRLSNRRTEFHDERAETRPIWLRQLGLRCVRDAE